MEDSHSPDSFLALQVPRTSPHSSSPASLWLMLLTGLLSFSSSVVSDSLQLHGLYVAHQASLSTEFSRQEHWNGLPRPPSGDLPNLGLLHCRRTLYYLSHQRQPDFFMSEAVEGSLNLEKPGRSGRTGFFVSHL